MAKKIFISYAFQDEKYLKLITNELREHGIIAESEHVELDHVGKIALGADIAESIREKIRAASLVVLFWTEKSAACANVKSSKAGEPCSPPRRDTSAKPKRRREFVSPASSR